MILLASIVQLIFASLCVYFVLLILILRKKKRETKSPHECSFPNFFIRSAQYIQACWFAGHVLAICISTLNLSLIHRPYRIAFHFFVMLQLGRFLVLLCVWVFFFFLSSLVLFLSIFGQSALFWTLIHQWNVYLREKINCTDFGKINAPISSNNYIDVIAYLICKLIQNNHVRFHRITEMKFGLEEKKKTDRNR